MPVAALVALTAGCSDTSSQNAALRNQVEGQARRLEELPTGFYEPGMGDLMHALQLRHAKLWFAGQGGNWPLAAFELHEIRESFDRVVRWQPQIEELNVPTSVAVKTWSGAALSALDAAVQQASRENFERAFDQLSTGCNACHTAAKHEFIVIQRPKTVPMDNQKYGTQ